MFYFFNKQSKDKKTVLKDAEALLPILTEQHNPGKYIEALNAVFDGQEEKFEPFRSINLSAAYSQLGDNVTARDLLLSVKDLRMNGNVQLVYLLNLAYIYFKLRDYKAVHNLIIEKRSVFARCSRYPQYKVIEIYDNISSGNMDVARKNLAAFPAEAKRDFLAEDILYLESLL